MRRFTNEEFIEKAIKIHKDKYIYSNVVYKNNDTKVDIVCKTHGHFMQTPKKHLCGQGCPECGKINRAISNTKTLDEFINEATLIHKGKYEYSKVNYRGDRIDVDIICKKHGVFKQKPNHHLCGHGCPLCKSSHMENDIREILVDNNIEFEEQKHFKWLGKKSLDFYLPKNNIAIECQGIQHFKPIEYFGGKDGLEYSKKRDIEKERLCISNNIKVIYYSDLKIQMPNNVLTDKNKLIEIVKNNNLFLL